MPTTSRLAHAALAALLLLAPACGDDGQPGENQNRNGPDAASSPGPVVFADPELERCIRDHFDGQEGDIWPSVLAPLTHLECQAYGITSLGGIEHLVGLTDLSLFENDIADLAPLAGLTGLTSLQLGGNDLADLTPLAGLTALTRLGLQDNRIADLAPLSSLTGLTWLNLDHNAIPDAALGSLGGLTALRWLTLEGNPIASLASLGDVLTLDVDLYSPVSAEARSLLASRRPLRQWGLRPSEPVFPVDRLPGPFGQPRPFPWNDPAWGVKDVDLDPFALASPNQYDAGSCLFMAVTGAMEILMNQQADPADVDYLGDTDLSERYLMNASEHLPRGTVPYFITDVLYTFNALGGALLSRDYPFTAGYMKEDANGDLVPAAESDPDAFLSCYYNWIDELPTGYAEQLTPTPKAERTVIFVDPDRGDSSIWNVGLMNDDIVERIKWELRTKNAPVIVVYNHYLYWHADIVIGYDDEASSRGCPMVESTLDYFREQGATSYVQKIEAHMAAEGGCSDQGIFYVRDSIYDGNDEPMYTYNATLGVSDRYSDRVITRSYNWVKYLANHTYTVHRKTAR